MDLKQLSRTLGLSPTTVSRALNGYSDVSESTRKRVVEAAERAGYQPNVAARRLALGKADAVGIIYPPNVGQRGFGTSKIAIGKFERTPPSTSSRSPSFTGSKNSGIEIEARTASATSVAFTEIGASGSAVRRSSATMPGGPGRPRGLNARAE